MKHCRKTYLVHDIAQMMRLVGEQEDLNVISLNVVNHSFAPTLSTVNH